MRGGGLLLKLTWPILFGGIAIVPAADSQTIVRGPLGARMDSLLTNMERLGAFSGAALVVQDTTVLLHRGYGTVSAESATPVTVETAFALASVSKQFTAAAVLALEADGKLRTSDSLAVLLPKVPPDKRGITIDQLLHHTSGLPRDVRPTSWFYRPVSRDTMVRAVLALPLESSPGSEFRYSNPNYTLLAAIVERVAGKPFPRYVQERLLARADLHATGFWGERTRWKPDQVARGRWGLYDVGSAQEWPSSWWSQGAGQMISTLTDLHTWFLALQGDRILLAPQREKLFAPGLGDYACGWYVRKKPDGTVGIIFHAGGNDGSGIEVRWYPARKLFMALACNLQLQDIRMSEDAIYYLFEAVRGGTLPVLPATVASKQLRAGIVGVYAHRDSGRFTLWADAGGRLFLSPDGPAAFDALYDWDSSFVARRGRALAVAQGTLDSLLHATCAAAAWDPPPIPQRLPEDWQPQWCLDATRLGRVRRIVWLGCAPLTWSTERTLAFSNVEFDRGQRIFAWLWERDEPIEAWSDDAVIRPQSVRLGSLGPGRFVAFDWFKGHATPLTIESDGSLVIGSAAAPIRALPVKAR